jgi:hypothetical protein
VSPGDPNFQQACVDGPGNALQKGITVALVGGAIGAGLMLGGALMNPHPVEAHEMRRLADEYNVALRRRLASPETPKPPARDTSNLTVYLAPVIGPTVRGLTLGVTF